MSEHKSQYQSINQLTDKSDSSDEDNDIQYNEFIQAIVHGGLDGIITTFATITSLVGADLNSLVIVVLGVSHLVADSLSMGTGAYASCQAKLELSHSERRRERRETKQSLHGEMAEMVDIYMQRGIQQQDAHNIVSILSKYPDQFLDSRMNTELGIPPSHHLANAAPIKQGLVTISSFILFGIVPLIPYLLSLIPYIGSLLTVWTQLACTIIITILTLFILGFVKGTLSNVQPINQSINLSWKSGVAMVANGAITASVGYLIGDLIGKAVHADTQLPMGVI